MSAAYYIRVLLTLLLFAGILYAVLHFSKKLHKKKFSSEIKIVDRLPIEAGVTLMIVDIRQQQLLISVGGKDVQILQKL